MFKRYPFKGLKYVLRRGLKNKITLSQLFVMLLVYYHSLSALPLHQISIVGPNFNESKSTNEIISDRYAVVNHRKLQPHSVLPFMSGNIFVPMSKTELQFLSRATYLSRLSSQYTWDEIKISRLLRVGDRDAVIYDIHSRLILLGDSDESLELSDLYTDKVASAVRSFQRRHGLNPDAIIGPNTLKWLNLNPHRRAELLTHNMQRKINFMANLGARYLLVNIPAYELLLSDNGEIALRSRVIVGKPKKPTPILTSEIKSMVINPIWRVPRSILEDDLLPKVKLNGDFFNQRDFSVYNYQNQRVEKSPEEWEMLANGLFPYRLEQMPGVKNTLGRYKFYFPNNFSVYLHDTTNPKLFSHSNRALSSGCIRIEKVDELANWIAHSLVDNKSLWSKLRFSRDITKWFPLNDALPVHLVYWTAWIDDSGLSQFRDDIYALQK
ncbi:L,D-transpeptidase family protein [Moritella sp. 36]|uniref:L,D-transpeptidase family protein n=1 Tax=Moritella sp. 36 TaxID=2746233 RepID=UPI0021069E62|nr:L,D-transpeptidase family protein [Moritella sp. 36]